jgi:hypothetical protein
MNWTVGHDLVSQIEGRLSYKPLLARTQYKPNVTIALAN